MALSDFLEQQASAALEHSREKENQRLLRQEERKDRLNEELSQYASRAIEALNEEIEQAAEKVKQISEMPMPSTPQECMKMIAECERKIALPIKEGKAASIMANVPDDEGTDIDFEKPSQMIHDAWKDRLSEIIDFAKTEFPDDENFIKYLKKEKRKKKKG